MALRLAPQPLHAQHVPRAARGGGARGHQAGAAGAAAARAALRRAAGVPAGAARRERATVSCP